MRSWKAWIVATLVLLPACSMRMGDLTIASPRLVDLDLVDLDSMPLSRRVEGEDKVWVFLFIPIGLPHIDDAIDDALDRGDGNILTDVTIHYEGWWFLIGHEGYRVTADVIDTRPRRKPTP